MRKDYYPKVSVFTLFIQILSGCGALDGTEISEAISVAIHCSNKGFSPTFYAPDVEICEVVDHCTKQVVDEKRHAFTESARLARSDILPLCECKATAAEGLIIPGGFGAAKTLLVLIDIISQF